MTLLFIVVRVSGLEPCMSVLSIYLGSLQKIESDETIFIDMRDAAVFSSARCAKVGSSFIAVTFIFRLFFRSQTTIFGMSILSSSICGRYKV